MALVEDAIILAGGRGTRMLPASLFMPKEMMPLIDTPILNHLVWEAAKAGVKRVHLVVSQRKKDILGVIEESADWMVNESARGDLPIESLSFGLEDLEIFTYVQSSAGGVADAISVALGGINGPFLVLLGDNLLISEHIGPVKSGQKNASQASFSLVERFTETGLPCIGATKVPSEEIRKFGCIEFVGNKVKSIIEKPDSGSAPSQYILCGRYLLPKNTAEILEKFPLDEFGEMQSIALMDFLIKNGGLECVKLEGFQLYDSGDPLSWLKSQIDHSLRRNDLGTEYKDWIRNRVLNEEVE